MPDLGADRVLLLARLRAKSPPVITNDCGSNLARGRLFLKPGQQEVDDLLWTP